jgi:predicted RNA-binding Zn ribbon-like protein
VTLEDQTVSVLTAAAEIVNAYGGGTPLPCNIAACWLPELRHQDVAEVHAVLRRLLVGPSDQKVRAVNRVLRDLHSIPSLVQHDSLGWHLHAAPSDAPQTTRILAESALVMAEVLRRGETGRIRVCAAPACQRLMVDLTRNQSRRYCGIRCGNRVAAAAHRGRSQVTADPERCAGMDATIPMPPGGVRMESR